MASSSTHRSLAVVYLLREVDCLEQKTTGQPHEWSYEDFVYLRALVCQLGKNIPGWRC